jgi:hypothetical protein
MKTVLAATALLLTSVGAVSAQLMDPAMEFDRRMGMDWGQSGPVDPGYARRGVTSTPNVFGGQNYSDGTVSTPNVFGGMNYRDRSGPHDHMRAQCLQNCF